MADGLSRQESGGNNPLRRHAKRLSAFAGQEPPEREWIVDGLIPVGQVTLLYGAGGLGKSLLAMQLMVTTAIGAFWCGRRTTACRSIALFAEDDMGELRRRFNGILKHYDLDCTDPRLEGLSFDSAVGQDNALVEFGSVLERDTGERRDLSRTTAKWADLLDWALKEEARVIFIDSLYDFFPGNENIRVHVRYFMSMLRHLAQEIDGAVVVLAHPSAAGLANGSGNAGSTAWEAAARSRLYFTKPPNDDDDHADRDVRVLKLMKSNYGVAGDEVRLRWRRGVFVVDEPNEVGLITHLERNVVDADFLMGLRRLKEQGRATSESRNASNYAPRLIRTLPGLGHHSMKAYTKSLLDLLAKGVIARTRIGTDSGRRPLIGLAEIGPELVLGDPP